MRARASLVTASVNMTLFCIAIRLVPVSARLLPAVSDTQKNRLPIVNRNLARRASASVDDVIAMEDVDAAHCARTSRFRKPG